VLFFIKYLALANDLGQKRFPFRQTGFKTRWSAYDQVEWKGWGASQSNLHRLVDLISRWHDNQQIDVAIGMGRAASIRAEKNDPLRTELLGYCSRKLADHAKRDARSAMPRDG
jgi:hypothetical protein